MSRTTHLDGIEGGHSVQIAQLVLVHEIYASRNEFARDPIGLEELSNLLRAHPLSVLPSFS